MASFDEFITSLERDFGPQGKGVKFEVFCKWFLKNDPQWSRVVDEVWRFEEYPDKWQTTDLGTDLVFKDKQGEIWAVQAKCFDEKYSTKKDDMNSFLADSGREQVSRRLWLQTTNKIESKALKTSKGQEKPVIFFSLDNFREAQIDYPDSFGDLFKAEVKVKPTPDKHQQIAITDVVKGFENADRGQLIMACGTGKTFTTLWIKEALKANSTLVLLPSLSLLSQTLHEWAWAGNTEFDILNVCSDKSVGKNPEDLKTADAPFRVTSDNEEIKTFLKNPNPKVLFCTYQSSSLIAEAHSERSIPAFDLVIADEAHRCAGKVSSDFANVLNDEKIRAFKRLFTTATPRVLGENFKEAAKNRELVVIDMNDALVFGKVLHHLTFHDAISYKPEPLLNDYQVVIIGVDEPTTKRWIRNYEIVDMGDGKGIDARTLAAKIALIKAMKDYDLERIISFHNRVSAARNFHDTFTNTIDIIDSSERPDGNIFCDYVSGNMKADDRKRRIGKLKSLNGYKRGLLTNAKCLSEGVDVPTLDGVAFIDPKGSQADIIQSVGRAIRKVRGSKVQKKGTIVLPVFIEDGKDTEEVIKNSNFQPIWNVLKALKSHDGELSDKLDEYRVSLGNPQRKNKEVFPDKIIFDLPLTVGSKFPNAIKTVLVESTTTSWNFWVALLSNYRENKGNCLVPVDHVENSYRLGNWVSDCRARFKKGMLSVEQVGQLNALDFVWDVLSYDWDLNIEKLKQFITREKHCLVPQKHVEDGVKLGIWVGVQRREYAIGRLSEERLNILTNLCFIWDHDEYIWCRNIEKLKQFITREKHCLVPQRHVEDGVKLGAWVTKCRGDFVNGNLSKEKSSQLNDLGFVWDGKQHAWKLGLEKLRKFYFREKHCWVIDRHIEDGFRLGRWVTRARANYKAGKLSVQQIKQLNKLGFIWDHGSGWWSLNIEKLKQFITREKHCLVPQKHVEDGVKLGIWVVNQRSMRSKGELSKLEIQELDDLGFIWNVLDYQWSKNYKKFQKFVGREKHVLVPIKHYEDDIALGSWVRQQKINYKKLSKERQKLLNNLGFFGE